MSGAAVKVQRYSAFGKELAGYYLPSVETESLNFDNVVDFVSSLNPLGIYYHEALLAEWRTISGHGSIWPVHQPHEARKNPRILVWLDCVPSDLLAYGYEVAEWAAEKFCGESSRRRIDLQSNKNWKRESWRIACEMLERECVERECSTGSKGQ